MRNVIFTIYNPGTKKWNEYTGKFHQWGSDYKEFESGPGNFTVGICETVTGKILTPLPRDMQFLD
jgi:hypothetical protein